jgi:hypothetical protein
VLCSWRNVDRSVRPPPRETHDGGGEDVAIAWLYDMLGGAQRQSVRTIFVH